MDSDGFLLRQIWQKNDFILLESDSETPTQAPWYHSSQLSHALKHQNIVLIGFKIKLNLKRFVYIINRLLASSRQIQYKTFSSSFRFFLACGFLGESFSLFFFDVPWLRLFDCSLVWPLLRCSSDFDFLLCLCFSLLGCDLDSVYSFFRFLRLLLLASWWLDSFSSVSWASRFFFVSVDFLVASEYFSDIKIHRLLCRLFKVSKIFYFYEKFRITIFTGFRCF